jgi:porphobilinogen synthase
MGFPVHRLRRLRRSEGVRRLVRETHLSVGDLIAPLFLCDGENQRQEIHAMPGVFRYSVDAAVEEARLLQQLNVPALLLFGVPLDEHKDPTGKEAWATEGLVQCALRAIREVVPGMVLIADTCFCEYTDHGHCGVLNAGKEVMNDRTLENLAHTAVSQARAGADLVAPSAMMDGQVSAIRKMLDTQGFEHVAIMSYAAKYASAFYGPFREAAHSTPSFGDRRQYQMDYHNQREAIREVRLDEEEGADIIMVKPALAYMDVIKAAREAANTPIAAFNVSGEYSMVKAAARNGWIDEKAVALEIVTGFKRAGADLVITYWAKDLARWLHPTPVETVQPGSAPTKSSGQTALGRRKTIRVEGDKPH